VCITFVLHYHLAINYYPAIDAFLGKLTLNLYFHVLFMLLSESDVHSVLISKRFLSEFLSLRNYKLKSVTRTLHIVHVSFFFYSIQPVGENLLLTTVILLCEQSFFRSS